MTSSLSLKNKRVLVPREKSSAKAFAQMVRKYEGTPVEIPLLAFKPTADCSELQFVLKNIREYDWIIFTSKVTVETFLSDWSGPRAVFPKLAAIGEKTAQVVEEKGWKVDFFPTEYVAEAFVTEFSTMIGPGTKVLIPKGNLARNYISSRLICLGAVVDELIVYDTYLPPESKAALAGMLLNGDLDIIPFTSPSTVDHFMEVVEQYHLFNRITSCMFACIGPVAKKRAESWGLTVHAVPAVYTVEHMLREIAYYIKRESSL
ncbi:uroporphyrinogen-III synthase [Bacillus sp. V3B]|uniref:uroporphyrinogen-III synthase n=1 Tax=Bacillus sp. V3B TaxID=2804915 RepID=UPI00210D0229|nr:uroporphyrinogen-III synthase [Bacillus sp. V3B]MCQ6273501.1 uroporphyrinogen-III synthase [Bacillus sp. V3B]